MITPKAIKGADRPVLKKNWIRGTVLTAFVAVLAFVVMALGLISVMSNGVTTNCGSQSSFGSGFGCAIVLIALAPVAAAITAVGITIFLLMKLVTPRLSLAILGGMHALFVMIGGRVIYEAIIKYVPDLIASELLRGLVVCTVLALMLTTALVIHLKLCSLALKKHILLAITVSAIVSIVYVRLLSVIF